MAKILFANIVLVTALLLFTLIHLMFSKVDPKHKFDIDMEIFQKNLTECAQEVKASILDVNHFMKRLPQETKEGKCFVACILKRNRLIENEKIASENLMASSRENYGDEEEVLNRLEQALATCSRGVEHLVDVCEYASQFNDCMHIHMEHILDKLAMERRMQALGQTAAEPEVEWNEDEEDILELFKDEL